MTRPSDAAARAEARPLWRALLWLAVLAPIFFLTYGFANWVTGLRQPVPEFVFSWERHIPFLPWTVIPYWTTDLFYGASLLLCHSRAELATLVRRLVAVQVLCVAGFLLVPLRFGFDRPSAGGLAGALFDALLSFDKPFNQAPSLHVALITVLWMAYQRDFGGTALWLIRAWFLLMVVSTLTTYQHHFIDLPLGLWAGLTAITLFPDEGRAPWSTRNRDRRRFVIAGVYGAMAALLVFLTLRVGPAGWPLLWPACALLTVAMIYCLGQPELFGKSNGALPPTVRAMLAPYLVGARLSARWPWRSSSEADEIAEGVWLGRFPGNSGLRARGFHSVVDVTAELPFQAGGLLYRGVPMLDLLAPTVAQVDAATQAIEALRTARPTLVCCALGYSRSATAVAAWLIASGRASSADEAIAAVRERRSAIIMTAAHRRLLERWAERRSAS